eukprot:scaffold1004_cov47-Prasinocladus_malaysianus.AAC.1
MSCNVVSSSPRAGSIVLLSWFSVWPVAEGLDDLDRKVSPAVPIVQILRCKRLEMKPLDGERSSHPYLSSHWHHMLPQHVLELADQEAPSGQFGNNTLGNSSLSSNANATWEQRWLDFVHPHNFDDVMLTMRDEIQKSVSQRTSRSGIVPG